MSEEQYGLVESEAERSIASFKERIGYVDSEVIESTSSKPESKAEFRIRNMRYTLGHLRRWDWSIPRSFLEELGVSNEQALHDLLHVILDGMAQDEYTQALRNALGRSRYDEDLPKSLMERRQQLADELGIRALKVREREEVAIERMAPKVLALIDSRASAKSENQDGALVTALLGLQRAITEQTAILREVNERLKRLDG